MATMERPTAVLEGGWVLEGTDGDGRLVRLTVGDTELGRAYLGLVVGRHPALSERVIDDPGVSRRHVRLGVAGGELYVEDLNSLNGTFVDGVPITPFDAARVERGQVLELGRVALRVSRLADDGGR
jgi:predicted component of type VI protein secretion system